MRLPGQALRRAAQRAHGLAAQTGTAIVISRNGVIEHIYPTPIPGAEQVEQVTAPGAPLT